MTTSSMVYRPRFGRPPLNRQTPAFDLGGRFGARLPPPIPKQALLSYRAAEGCEQVTTTFSFRAAGARRNPMSHDTVVVDAVVDSAAELEQAGVADRMAPGPEAEFRFKSAARRTARFITKAATAAWGSSVDRQLIAEVAYGRNDSVAVVASITNRMIGRMDAAYAARAA